MARFRIPRYEPTEQTNECHADFPHHFPFITFDVFEYL